MNLKKKSQLRQKRIWRIRKQVRGTQERPRLCVHFSHKNISAQVIDDEQGKTLISASTLDKDVRDKKLKANCEGARELAKVLSDKAKSAGVESVVFDRNGKLYHGVVSAFADSAREAGLNF